MDLSRGHYITLFWGDQTWCKRVVSLRDFPYDSALFGLAIQWPLFIHLWMVDVHLVRGSIKRLYGESLIGMKEIDGNSINQHFVLFVRPYSFKNPTFSCCFRKKSSNPTQGMSITSPSTVKTWRCASCFLNVTGRTWWCVPCPAEKIGQAV